MKYIGLTNFDPVVADIHLKNLDIVRVRSIDWWYLDSVTNFDLRNSEFFVATNTALENFDIVGNTDLETFDLLVVTNAE